ncbi:hypothetical protein [Neoaquamicrobium sediminum]|uniref:hypothetical protein n=1 Tax=Neoaquamicrobium sediminum TaxID=1849104 RepID=UPI00403848D0
MAANPRVVDALARASYDRTRAALGGGAPGYYTVSSGRGGDDLDVAITLFDVVVKPDRIHEVRLTAPVDTAGHDPARPMYIQFNTAAANVQNARDADRARVLVRSPAGEKWFYGSLDPAQDSTETAVTPKFVPEKCFIPTAAVDLPGRGFSMTMNIANDNSYIGVTTSPTAGAPPPAGSTATDVSPPAGSTDPAAAATSPPTVSIATGAPTPAGSTDLAAAGSTDPTAPTTVVGAAFQDSIRLIKHRFVYASTASKPSPAQPSAAQSNPAQPSPAQPSAAQVFSIKPTEYVCTGVALSTSTSEHSLTMTFEPLVYLDAVLDAIAVAEGAMAVKARARADKATADVREYVYARKSWVRPTVTGGAPAEDAPGASETTFQMRGEAARLLRWADSRLGGTMRYAMGCKEVDARLEERLRYAAKQHATAGSAWPDAFAALSNFAADLVVHRAASEAKDQQPMNVVLMRDVYVDRLMDDRLGDLMTKCANLPGFLDMVVADEGGGVSSLRRVLTRLCDRFSEFRDVGRQLVRLVATHRVAYRCVNGYDADVRDPHFTLQLMPGRSLALHHAHVRARSDVHIPFVDDAEMLSRAWGLTRADMDTRLHDVESLR